MLKDSKEHLWVKKTSRPSHESVQDTRVENHGKIIQKNRKKLLLNWIWPAVTKNYNYLRLAIC